MTDCETHDHGFNDPLEVLPEEIWEIVFEKLKIYPNSLLSCWKAFEGWHGVLEKDKLQWMFGEILPLIFVHLDNGSILKCRAVCHTWKLCVDDFIENHPCYQASAPDNFNDGDNGKESVYFPLIKKKLHELHFYQTEHLDRFQLEMQHYARNPIVGRSVRFNCQKREDWMEKGLDFLSVFGRHIWYFTMDTLHDPGTVVHWLRRYLYYLPNLRRLKIFPSTVLLQSNELSRTWCNDVKENLRINPLPPLPSLEIVEITIGSLSYEPFEFMIASYANQIKRLQIDALNEVIINESICLTKNLRELTLTVTSNNVLESLAWLSYPKLHKLTLFFNYDQIDMYSLFDVLDHFKGNLRVLKINLNSTANFKMKKFRTPLPDLKFPKLKAFVLVNGENLAYDFLLGMKSLEYFHYEKWQKRSLDTSSVAFKRVKDCIPYPNSREYVANLFPLLKKFVHRDFSMAHEIR